MLAQILIGSLLISVTVIIEAAFIGMAIAVLNRHGPNLLKGHRIIKMTLFITGITLWMVAALTIAVWLWAVTFMVLELFVLPTTISTSISSSSRSRTAFCRFCVA